MFGFFKGMKIDYYAIINASLNKKCFRFEFNKNSALCHLQHKMFGFLKEMKIDFFAILTASLNKAVYFLNLFKKQRLLPLTT
jgi:hypothetical protein